MAKQTALESQPDTVPDSAAGVLTAARDRRRAADLAEADLCELAVAWAIMHPADSIHDAAVYYDRGGNQTDVELAGPGAPSIAEYAVAEFATAVGLSEGAGRGFLGECLELRYRLPRLWKRVVNGSLPAWKARLVARATIRLTPEAAGFVDQHVAPVAHKVRPAQLDRLVNEAIGRFMPEEVERLAVESWDKRHVTVFDQLVSFTGTMLVEAELDIADALDLDAAVAAGAAQRADLGSHESLDVRRAQALGDLARGQLPLDLLPGHTDSPHTAPADPTTPDPTGPDPTGPDQTALPAVPRKAPPRQVVLYVHLSHAAVDGVDGVDGLDSVARLERGNSLVSVEQVRTWCGNPDTQITVKPVIDLEACTWSDTDTVPDQIKEKVALRDRTCVFPWCTRPARTCHPHAPTGADDPGEHPCDNDHVIARGRNGATCSCNIAPLCRRHHRLKTHSPWTYTVLDPGTYLWTSPHGYQFLRDPDGTTDVTTDVTPDLTPDRRPVPTPPIPHQPPDT
jgi:hypothetical protein